MIIVLIASWIVAILAILFGFRCWWEVKRWHRWVQLGRIVVAYKGKVKLDTPLIEWALWLKKLDDDKDYNGRVVYQMGGTSLAIRKHVKTSKGRTIQRKKGASTMRQGSWSGTDDKTGAKQKVTQ